MFLSLVLSKIAVQSPLWIFSEIFFLKDTHWEKAPSNKTPALTKRRNMGICVVGTSNHLFIRGS